jgi:hypothetical protein
MSKNCFVATFLLIFPALTQARPSECLHPLPGKFTIEMSTTSGEKLFSKVLAPGTCASYKSDEDFDGDPIPPTYYYQVNADPIILPGSHWGLEVELETDETFGVNLLTFKDYENWRIGFLFSGTLRFSSNLNRSWNENVDFSILDWGQLDKKGGRGTVYVPVTLDISFETQ